MFPIVNFFGKQIGVYALFSLCGLSASTLVATKLGKKHKIYFEDIILLILVITAGILIGGHILYASTHLDKIFIFLTKIKDLSFKEIIASLSKIFGGMVFYGGFIGAFLSVKIYLNLIKYGKKNVYIDIFAVCIPLFHFFGRIGCFFGGCCFGIESKIGFLITNNPLVPEINGVKRFPISLVEATMNMIIFVILLILYNRNKYSGEIIYFYMLFYPIVRFVTEFFRGDNVRGFIGFLSISQWISIILFICAGIHFLKKHAKIYNKKILCTYIK